MMQKDNIIEVVNSICDDSRFPKDFLTEYNLMECMSERNGVETYLVSKTDGSHFIAKCYDKSLYNLMHVNAINNILNNSEYIGLPRHISSFEDQKMIVYVREYIDGISLSKYMTENNLTENDIVTICIQLCNILSGLHELEPPIIHRDIKPGNVIVKPDGSISLIDFDIARTYNKENETDTYCFGTQIYAPPEQYGFSQTDARTDIYSIGVLLRFLLTGNARENKNIKVYRPLSKIIDKCTAFAPKDRYSSTEQVKKALLAANPKKQRQRIALFSVACLSALVLLIFGGVKLYQYITYTPFYEDAVPAYISDEERVKDAVAYMSEHFDTALFDDADEILTIGYVRKVLIEIYGLERDYVYGINADIPQESPDYFLPWGWDDTQNVIRDVMVYVAVKLYDPTIVSDWSSIKDDNGYYPGGRVAVAFAEDTGILTGANRPGDITIGDMAIILANADRVFKAKEE